jgi:hypothetical protein
MATKYIIPDVLVTWPWKRMINPMLAEVNDDANAWVKSLALLEPNQLEQFYTYKFSTYIHFNLKLISFSGHERLIDIS